MTEKEAQDRLTKAAKRVKGNWGKLSDEENAVLEIEGHLAEVRVSLMIAKENLIKYYEKEDADDEFEDEDTELV